MDGAGATPHNDRGLAGLALGAGLVLAATLVPDYSRTGVDPCGAFDLTCGSTRAVDFLLNVLLFTPLGLAAGRRWGPWPRPVLLGLGLATAVEILQATVIPGRDPSARDVLANTLGAGAGALLGLLWHHLVRPTRRAAAALATGGGAALTVVLLCGAYLLGPSAPRSQWFGQHRAELQGFDRFPGRVIDATLAGQPLPSYKIEETALRWARQHPLAIGATFVTGGEATARIAPIVSVFDDFNRMIGLVGQRGEGLVFAARTRAEDWGFRPLVALFPEVRLTAAADTVRLLASYRRGVLEVQSGPPGAWPATLARQAIGPAEWWRLVTPRGGAFTATEAAIATTLALLLSLAPVGWYGRLWVGFGGRRAGAVLAAAVPAAVALLPIPLGFPVASAAVWAGGLAGWAIGWLAAGYGRGAVATTGRRREEAAEACTRA